MPRGPARARPIPGNWMKCGGVKQLKKDVDKAVATGLAQSVAKGSMKGVAHGGSPRRVAS